MIEGVELDRFYQLIADGVRAVGVPLFSVGPDDTPEGQIAAAQASAEVGETVHAILMRGWSEQHGDSWYHSTGYTAGNMTPTTCPSCNEPLIRPGLDHYHQLVGDRPGRLLDTCCACAVAAGKVCTIGAAPAVKEWLDMPTRTPKRERSKAPARTAIKTTPAKKRPAPNMRDMRTIKGAPAAGTPKAGRPAADKCPRCKTPMTPDNRSKGVGECLTCARARARAGRIARGEVRNVTAAERRRVSRPARVAGRGKGARRGK